MPKKSRKSRGSSKGTSAQTPKVDKRLVLATPVKQPQVAVWEHFGMSPPCMKSVNAKTGDKEIVYLSMDAIEARMKYDGMGKYIKERGKTLSFRQKVCYYLYGIGYKWDNSKIKNETEEDQQDRIESIKEYYKEEGARERIKGILSYGPFHCDTDPDAVKFWEQNQSLVLRYIAQPNTSSFFLEREITFVAHRQQSSNCYMLATARNLGYEACIRQYKERLALGNDAHLKSISLDLPQLVRHHLQEEGAFEKRVKFNKGGNPVELTMSLIAHCKGISIQTINIFKEYALDDITKTLKDHPIVIEHFITDEMFRQARKISCGKDEMIRFDVDPVTNEDVVTVVPLSEPAPGEREFIERAAAANGITLSSESDDLPKSEDDLTAHDVGDAPGQRPNEEDNPGRKKKRQGSHSLLMIATRFELLDAQTRKDWYLIQNSWRLLQLLEVSRAYLIKHLTRENLMVPLIHLYGEGSLDLPNSIEPHYGVYVSSDYDDGGDEMGDDMEDGELQGKKLFP